MDKVAGGAIGILAGVYLIRVASAGNTDELLKMLKEETGYLELLAALYALYLLHKFGPTSQITDQLVMLALVAAIIKVTAGSGNLVGELERFGRGDQSLFTTAKRILGV